MKEYIKNTKKAKRRNTIEKGKATKGQKGETQRERNYTNGHKQDKQRKTYKQQRK